MRLSIGYVGLSPRNTQKHSEAYKVKKVSIICPVGLLFILLLGFGCPRNFPTESVFKDWLQVVYERETGLQADEITVFSWERIPQEVLKKAPDLDGLKVEAMIFTFSAKNIPSRDHFIEIIIHYVYCNYYRISDEWYLHASSWGAVSGNRSLLIGVGLSRIAEIR
jgi:hypothetical protein